SPQLCATFGGSDNNHLAQHGIAGIVPATAMNQCHTCQEYTTVQELARAAQLAAALMTSEE
ncbi:MAG: peptidase T, partial [Butyricicoccus sp.]